MKMDIDTILNETADGREISTAELLFLFETENELGRIISTADRLNRSVNGDVVSFVHNRNINFTNICRNKCGFCGFRRLQGDPDAFLLTADEILSAIAESPEITEVCLQGGINRDFGVTQALDLLRAVKGVYPNIHIHAFSPMEIKHFSETAARPVETVLSSLIDAGLDSIPGTAAEILVDEIRRVICPDKLTTQEWVGIITAAHKLGLKSTATIMAGHIEKPAHVVAHFEILRQIQGTTAGFTEFIPLFFVPQKTALAQKFNITNMIALKQVKRLYALARIYFNGYIDNIQSSWPKLGLEGAVACLEAGVNDLGGTLYSENITRSAGGIHGQSVGLNSFRTAIHAQGKTPRQRDTLYNLLLSDQAPQN